MEHIWYPVEEHITHFTTHLSPHQDTTHHRQHPGTIPGAGAPAAGRSAASWTACGGARRPAAVSAAADRRTAGSSASWPGPPGRTRTCGFSGTLSTTIQLAATEVTRGYYNVTTYQLVAGTERSTAGVQMSTILPTNERSF